MNKNGQNKSSEVQQLIDFLLLHGYTYKTIAEDTGYSQNHIYNIYNGHESAQRAGFTHMFRSLAIETMLKAAYKGTLVKPELPATVQIEGDQIRVIMDRISQLESKI
ncbi:MAG TPA: hypothetical protein VKP65_20055 [Rhodothermales bacterium]|nr:hypothetical protein [Rhodothermales bacterium]